MNEIERKNRRLKIRAIMAATDRADAHIIAEALVLYREAVGRIGAELGAVETPGVVSQCTRLASLYYQANRARDEYEARAVQVEVTT